jgi:hypothetical protein
LRIAGIYSHAGAEQIIQDRWQSQLNAIQEIIGLINAERCRLKAPQHNEVARAVRRGITHFFSPPHLNSLFDYYLHQRGWDIKPRIYTGDADREGGFREMDAIQYRLGLELQFGKYSFLTYDIIAKMVIFRNCDLIDCGVEICLMSSMLPHMSSGIGAFEQVVWDLRTRGTCDADIPVLVLGIESDEFNLLRQQNPQLTEERIAGVYRTAINRYPVLDNNTLARVRETGLDV